MRKLYFLPHNPSHTEISGHFFYVPLRRNNFFGKIRKILRERKIAEIYTFTPNTFIFNIG